MKPEKNPNQSQVNNEITHIVKTIIPIVIFTIVVIVISLFIVSMVYDVPLELMFKQFIETFKAVVTFTSGK